MEGEKAAGYLDHRRGGGQVPIILRDSVLPRYRGKQTKEFRAR